MFTLALLLATRTLRASEAGRGCYHTHTTGEVKVQIFDTLKMIFFVPPLAVRTPRAWKRGQGGLSYTYVLEVVLNIAIR